MVPEDSIICSACKKHGVTRYLSPREIDGCQRLGIPPHCSAHVRSLIAHRAKKVAEEKRLEANEEYKKKSAENRARADKSKGSDELFAAEAAKELGIKLKFLSEHILSKGLLPYRELPDQWKRAVIKRSDLESFKQAAVDGEPWVPDLVRELIRLGLVYK